MQSVPIRRTLTRPPPITYATVPRLWPDSTIVCLGNGPSLNKADVDFCCGSAHVIAVNDARRLAPWCDVLYADAAWWNHHGDPPGFAGLKFAIENQYHRLHPDLKVGILRNDGVVGLSRDPSALRTGLNSGYQCINLAVHLGASRIVLLGYDMGRTRGATHWFGNHPRELGDTPVANFVTWRRHFETLVEPLRARGISVVNASRESALKCFERKSLEDALG